jgi:hypothetical protein
MRIFLLIFSAIILLTYAFGCKKSETASIKKEKVRKKRINLQIKSTVKLGGSLWAGTVAHFSQE